VMSLHCITAPGRGTRRAARRRAAAPGALTVPLEVTPRFAIADEAFELKFIRAGGPGGQNVNKVATAVQLRVVLDRCGLMPEVRARLERLAGRRLTDAGEVVIAAQRFRTQERNREDARARLAAFIEHGLHAPRPRIATRPTGAAKKRRLDAKRARGDTKKARVVRDWD